MDKCFVGAFLYNPQNNTVLLHKRDMEAKVNPGLWGFFGGSSENNENPKQAIIRELKEELNIDVKSSGLIDLCNYFNEKYGHQSYIFVVKSELKKDEMTLGEGADFDWVPLDKVFGYQLTENTAKSLQKLVEVKDSL